jgi:hypothetical protein
MGSDDSLEEVGRFSCMFAPTGGLHWRGTREGIVCPLSIAGHDRPPKHSPCNSTSPCAVSSSSFDEPFALDPIFSFAPVTLLWLVETIHRHSLPQRSTSA